MHRLKKGDRELVAAFARIHDVPLARGPRRVSLRVTLGPRNKKFDRGAPWKSLFDALKHAGMIREDTVEEVDFGTIEFRHGKALSTTIILEDI